MLHHAKAQGGGLEPFGFMNADVGKGIYLDVDFLYMPSIAPFADDWLFRSFIDFTVPLFDPIALKLLLTNVNDDNPSPDEGNNKFTATMALSLEF